jgi:hypothetical protein
MLVYKDLGYVDWENFPEYRKNKRNLSAVVSTSTSQGDIKTPLTPGLI